MSGADQHRLSTSALAKALDIPLQQMFGTLRDCGWIRKVDDGWVLTAKGEFEGGEYVHSRRYGRYIVWPEALLEHQLLRGIESNRLLNSAQLARRYQISAREVRRALGDLGLLRRTFNGWEPTHDGERLGAVAVDSDSGDGDVTWPESVLENDVVNAQLDYLRRTHYADAEREADLLDAISEFEARDGHRFRGRNEMRVCDWLYFAGIAHACHYRLPLAEAHFQEQRADFWLPAAQVYIEVGGDEKEASTIAAALQRIDIYRRQQWRWIEVRSEHFEYLDNYLTRELREFGVRIL